MGILAFFSCVSSLICNRCSDFKLVALFSGESEGVFSSVIPGEFQLLDIGAVSYTHLDVYKRQVWYLLGMFDYHVGSIYA